MHVTLNLSLFQTHINSSANESAVPAGLEREAYLTLRGDAPRALVVYANHNERGTLRRLLELQSFLIYEACSQSQVLELAGRVRPDIVLLDVTAHRTGSRTVRAIRSGFDLRSLPVIVLATPDDIAALEECLAAGANDFVFTPVEWPELYLRMRLHLACARPQLGGATNPVSEIWA